MELHLINGIHSLLPSSKHMYGVLVLKSGRHLKV